MTRYMHNILTLLLVVFGFGYLNAAGIETLEIGEARSTVYIARG